MILAILQARTSSTRLPGKVLKLILGEPMLLRQIERIKRSRRIDRLVVATSTELSDGPIETLCRENGIECFRGSLDDVLDRFYQATRLCHPDYVVRLTADCPLCDPDVIDGVIDFGISGGFDYTSNAIPPTFPDGLDAEIFRLECMEQAWREARLPSQREMVTPFIYQHPERFRLGNYTNSTDLSHLRWTVDEPLDFELVTQIYGALYPSKADFSFSEILALVERRPELKSLNTIHRRNEGYEIALLKDKMFNTNDQ